MPLVDLIDQHATAREAVVTKVLQTLSSTWTNLGSWDRADIEVFVSRAVPVVRAGQLLTAQLVDVYVAQVLTEIEGHYTAPLGVPGKLVTGARGVDPATVYTRPAIGLWKALSDGMEWSQAFEAAQARLSELADDDLSLAYRAATTSVMERQPRVSGYRRILHPERGTCGLCIAAADQVYHSSDLLPIHSHCRCTVSPIVGDNDPGNDINGQDITELYKAASQNGTSAQALSNVKFTVHEHGELGPILYPAGQHFTGPAQIASSTD